MHRFLPILHWGRHYTALQFTGDLTAAVIVTVMLIPQSLAYALLAGLPAEMGLYASIIPLIAYAFFGTSRTLSVGPVAVVSLMTAAAVGTVAEQGTADYATAAITLAALSGLLLIVFGLLRFGFISNFLSHPVVSGFITASGIIIALSQLQHILGISGHGETLPTLLLSLYRGIGDLNVPTAMVGTFALVFLLLCRNYLSMALNRLGFSQRNAEVMARTAPVIVIILTILAALFFDLETRGVALVGHVPSGLPAFTTPLFDLALIEALLVPAFLIALIGFVESVSVGRTLGSKRRERIDPNQELVGLGAANIASAFSGGFPVTGGFSRSVVNFDAGAQTQAASIMTAGGIALAAMVLTPALYFLPKATLAATIIVAVTSLIDWRMVQRAWDFSRNDFVAVTATILLTLGMGVEIGVLAGVVASIGMHLYKTSKPHFAIVGTVPGTQHYRNIDRHDVVTYPNIVSIRIDESLYFANAHYLHDVIMGQLANNDRVRHVVLMCPAVNEIDLSALEALSEINQQLREQDIKLHFSEIKGPVMDALRGTEFMDSLEGNIYLCYQDAINDLAATI